MVGRNHSKLHSPRTFPFFGTFWFPLYARPRPPRAHAMRHGFKINSVVNLGLFMALLELLNARCFDRMGPHSSAPHNSYNFERIFDFRVSKRDTMSFTRTFKRFCAALYSGNSFFLLSTQLCGKTEPKRSAQIGEAHIATLRVRGWGGYGRFVFNPVYATVCCLCDLCVRLKL